MENQVVHGVLLIVGLLSIGVFSSIVLKRINFPYTIGLVVIGCVLGFLSYNYNFFEIFMSPELSPEIILYLILPVLIFEAAMNIDFAILRRNLVPIFLLAVFGLLISAFVVGAGVSFLTSLSFMGALVFGALISATDPVAVIALFNEIGAPKRLVTLIDGESIFNDATAIVLFEIVLFSALHPDAPLNLFSAGAEFFIILCGGVLVGVCFGVIGLFVNNLGKDNLLIQVTISVIIAYLSFVISDHFCHFSGVMSTLAAGLIMRAGAEKTIKRSNIVTLEHFWEYFSFIANSIVFLLLGLTEIHIFRSTHNIIDVIKMTLCMIPVVIAARGLCIYLIIPLYNRLNSKHAFNKISSGYQFILFWGGLRGAVPVALVLAIPESFPHRDMIIQFTFAFILFTLLFQGTTIKWMMNRLGIRPEVNEFGDRVVENHSFDFKNEGLAHLITNALRDMFDDEGYLVRDKSTLDGAAYLMNRGKMMLYIEQLGGRIVLTAEHENVTYFKRVLYETLLDFDKSVIAIKDITNPDKMNDLIADDDCKDDGNNKLSFNIMRYISKDRIVMNIDSRKKDDIIFELVKGVVECGAVDQKDFAGVLSDVLEREKTMTTALGDNVAMPHARKCAYVKNITVLIACVREGVDFDAVDSKPVNIFVLILSPKDAVDPHVQVLAAMSKILIKKENRDLLLKSDSPEELYMHIEEIAKL
jgi:CPA1 family monovalent cation:H+ antiporter